MPRCESCNKKITLCNSMKCKWCKIDYCITCLPIETHKCSCEHDYKENAKTTLIKNLEKNKTQDIKCIKI